MFCKMLKCHYDVNFANGKTSYFKREVQLRLAAITRFEKWP